MIEQLNMRSSSSAPCVITALKASEFGRRASRRDSTLARRALR
jgi:hypothetical protein